MTVVLIIIGVIILLNILSWIINKINPSNDFEPTSKDWWLLGAIVDMSNKYADSVKKDKKK